MALSMIVQDADNFRGEFVARLWNEVDFDAVMRLSAYAMSRNQQDDPTERWKAEEAGWYEASFHDLGDIKKSQDIVEEILEEVIPHVNFGLARKMGAPLERIFFNSLATRVEELRAIQSCLEVISETKPEISLREHEILFGPSSGLGREFWFGGLEEKESGEPEYTGVCPPIARFFITERLRSGASVLTQEEQERLEQRWINPREMQERLMVAEAQLFAKATRVRKLPEGKYRFGIYRNQAHDEIRTEVGEQSRIVIPREDFVRSGNDSLAMFAGLVNCELRTAISTRELFYLAIEDKDSPETRAIRPLVPLMAKSLNQTMLDGLIWFEHLRVLGLKRMHPLYDQGGIGVIMNFVLNPGPYQAERSEALLRYASLSLPEIQFILRTEDMTGKVFAPDRFSDWGYLSHYRYLKNPDPVLAMASELLGGLC